MDKQKPSKLKIFCGGMLLLGLCIGIAELLVCRVADPALYQRIVGPVKREAQMLLDAGASMLGDAGDWISGKIEQIRFPTTDFQSQPDLQRAEEPELTDGGEAVTDPAITELTERDGQQVLTGGSIDLIYFNQTDSRWCDQPYGSDPIGSYACGPTVMSILVSSMTGQVIDPLEMSGWAYRNGYYARRSGSYHAIVAGTAAAYGLQAEAFHPLTVDALRQQLSSGGVMVALMTKGHFTNSGHFIILRGTTLDGNILVADPYSTERSLQSWDAQLILDELSSSRDSGAPLWLISKTM